MSFPAGRALQRSYSDELCPVGRYRFLHVDSASKVKKGLPEQIGVLAVEAEASKEVCLGVPLRVGGIQEVPGQLSLFHYSLIGEAKLHGCSTVAAPAHTTAVLIVTSKSPPSIPAAHGSSPYPPIRGQPLTPRYFQSSRRVDPRGLYGRTPFSKAKAKRSPNRRMMRARWELPSSVSWLREVLIDDDGNDVRVCHEHGRTAWRGEH